MSSQEVANYLNDWYDGKRTIRHDNVKTSIERLVNQRVITSPALQEKPSTGGRPGTVYVFYGEQGRKDCITLVAQLSPEHTAMIVDRWLELEKQAAAPKLPDFTNPAIAARAWADEVEQKLALAAQIEQQKPVVDFANRITNTKQTWSRRDAAKIIQYPPQAFNQWLKDNRHSNVNGAPSQTALNRGHQKVTCGEKNGHAYSNARITMKGLRYYATKIYSSEVPDDVLESLDNAQAQAESQGE